MNCSICNKGFNQNETVVMHDNKPVHPGCLFQVKEESKKERYLKIFPFIHPNVIYMLTEAGESIDTIKDKFTYPFTIIGITSDGEVSISTAIDEEEVTLSIDDNDETGYNDKIVIFENKDDQHTEIRFERIIKLIRPGEKQ